MLHVVGFRPPKTKALLRQQESRMDLRYRIILGRFRQRRGAPYPCLPQGPDSLVPL
jgi:hypothetical protein